MSGDPSSIKNPCLGRNLFKASFSFFSVESGDLVSVCFGTIINLDFLKDGRFSFREKIVCHSFIVL